MARSAFFAEACDKPLLSKVAVESECLSDPLLPHAVKTGDIEQTQLARLDQAPFFKCALKALFSNYDHPCQYQYGVFLASPIKILISESDEANIKLPKAAPETPMIHLAFLIMDTCCKNESFSGSIIT